MNIHYKIVSKNPDDHSFVARYWTDKISEDSLASQLDEAGEIVRGEDGSPIRCRSDVNITLYEENATAEEIDALVKINAPWAWLETLEKVQDPEIDTSMDTVEVGVAKSFDFDKNHPVLQQPKPPEQFSDAELNGILKNLGIEVK
jgi:hypothetical protein